MPPSPYILPIPSRSVAISKSNSARNVWRLQLQHKRGARHTCSRQRDERYGALHAPNMTNNNCHCHIHISRAKQSIHRTLMRTGKPSIRCSNHRAIDDRVEEDDDDRHGDPDPLFFRGPIFFPSFPFIELFQRVCHFGPIVSSSPLN